MSTVAEAFAMALQYHQAGNLQQTEALCRQILHVAPGHADTCRLLAVLAQTHTTMGNTLKKLAQLDQALACYLQAFHCNPHDAGVRLNLANTLRLQGKPREALAHAQQAVRVQPRLADSHYELGAALQDLGQAEEAAAAFRLALQLRPEFAEAHNRLGMLLQSQGRIDEAAEHLRHAVRCRPNYVEAHYNLGNALRIAGQLQEAAACYQEALRLQPNCAEALYSLGALFAEQENLEQAAAFFQKALRLRPALADAHGALGVALAEQGKVQEAAASLEQALRLGPTTRLRILSATRLPVIYQSKDDLESWRQRLIREVHLLREQGVVLDLTNEPAVNLFYLAYQGHSDRDIQRELGRLYRVPEQALAKAHTGGKIRIGFLSSYFRMHTIGHWMRGLIAGLSRDDFEVIVLSVGSHKDEIASFIRQHADRYLEVPKHLPSARRLIADQRLDVLFYADIGMEPITGTLAFSRLAPVQCVTLGHPVTTGIDTIDYFISTEDLETDEGEQHYTEKLVKLKTLPIHYYRPRLPTTLVDRQHFGLAEGDHVYTCLQSLFKFHPDFDALLGGILRGDARGTLVLAEGLRPHWSYLVQQRFAVTLPDVQDRIRFLPRLGFHEYLNLLRLSDVLLDTCHFGGGSTSYEGLAVGTPIVTLPSRLLRGRITWALYKQMNVLDAVAQSPQEFIDIALRLGTDADYREALRRKILAANSLLFENNEGIRHLEHFLHQAACGLAPRDPS